MVFRERLELGENTRENIVWDRTCAALATFQTQFCGVTWADENYYLCRENSGVATIMWTLGGSGLLWHENAWHTLESGAVIRLPAGPSHLYKAGENGWHFGWIVQNARAPLAPTVWETDVCEPFAVSAALEGLYREHLGAADREMESRWCDLIHRYAARSQRQQSEEERSLWRVWSAVDAEMHRDWSLSDLAREAHMSEETLRRFCLKQTGHSPIQHLSYLRMQRAASLLSRTSWNVSQVARSVGYDNQFAFSSAFKKWIGSAPSDFRKRLSEEKAV